MKGSPDLTQSPAYVFLYRGGNKGLFVLLRRTQAGPGRTVKQEHEEISRNHVQTFISPSVLSAKIIPIFLAIQIRSEELKLERSQPTGTPC